MSIESFDQFLELLHARPDWRQELQRVVLTDRLLSLPDTVAELANAQVRTEARLEELAQAQVRTEARLEELAQAQVRTEAKLEELAQAQHRTEERLQALIEQVSGISLRADEFMGFMVEQRYRQKAHAYFAPIMRRIHVLSGDELDRLLEDAIERGLLDERDSLQLRWADAVIRGRRDGEETYLVVEASVLVDLDDVRRAADRAHFLRLTGPPALPVAAGRRVTPAAVAEARSLGVWLVTNGRVDAPPDMVA